MRKAVDPLRTFFARPFLINEDEQAAATARLLEAMIATDQAFEQVQHTNLSPLK